MQTRSSKRNAENASINETVHQRVLRLLKEPKHPRLKKINTQNKSSLSQLPIELKNHLCTFLDSQTMSRLSNTCRLFSSNYKRQILDRLLLELVLHSNDEGVKKLLSHMLRLYPDTLWTTVLARGQGRGKWYDVEPWWPTRKIWTAISPIEYAAWDGNNLILSMLLSIIPDRFKWQAVEQLKSVMNSKKAQDIAIHMLISNLENSNTQPSIKC
jgi:hypothetical protein